MNNFGAIIKLTIQLIMAIVVLSLEQVVGLPMVFLLLSLYVCLSKTIVTRCIVLIMCGGLLAAAYQLSFGLGLAVLWGLVGFFKLSEKRFASVGVRLLLAAVVGSGVVGLLSGASLAVTTVLSIMVSMLVSWLVTKFLLLRTSTHAHIRF